MEENNPYGDLNAWRRQTILIVDDEANIRSLLFRVLSKSGFAIKQAANAEEALGIAREGNIDLLLTDIIMRGMNGVELAQKLQEQQPNMRVLFTSGCTAEQLQRYKLPQNAEFIAKPWVPEDVLQTAIRLVGDKHPNIAD
jgi:DNA-binding NtrC family response regulator